MTTGRSPRPWLAVLAIAAVFATKLAVLLQIGHHPLLVPTGDLDGFYDVHFAQQVVRGDVWLKSPESFFGRAPVPFIVPPLYVYVLAACLKLFRGSLDAVRFVQALLGTAGVWLVALTARRWFGDRGAWFAGALAALCGLFTFYEVLILHSALDPFLSALDLYLLTRAAQGGGVLAWAVAGAALGVHALNEGHVALVFIGFALVLAVRAVIARRGVRPLLAFTAAGLLAISPAAVRNWTVTREFFPIKSGAGLDLLIGNGPEADGSLKTTAGIPPTVTGRLIDEPRVVHDALGRDASTSEQSQFFSRRALGWIRDHPGAELRLVANKLRYALSATYVAPDYSFPFFARDLGGLLAFLAVGPALFVPLGLVGLVMAARSRPSAPPASGASASTPRPWPLVTFAALAVVPLLIFFVRARLRVPLQVALVVAAGGALAWMADRLARRAWAPLAIAVAATAALALFVAWPTRLDDGRTETELAMGLQEIRTGHAADGEVWVSRALTRGASPVAAHLAAGRVYDAATEPAEALRHYRQALAADPSDPAAHYAVGQTLLSDGKVPEAIAELELARRGDARDNATQLLVLALARQRRTDEVNRLIHEVDPSHWSADQARGFALALADAGRVDLSIAAWMRAADAGGGAHDFERLGLSWAMVGRPAEAVAALARAAQLDPSAPTIRLNYGVALFSVGRVDDARREAEEALRLDPSSEKARRFLDAIRKK